jgi:TP901 family phage tail tape measure protein
MRFLGMAGFETNQIISAMPGLLDLAAAGQLELADAADIASNILSGFRLNAEESGRVADILAATAASANTSVTQLGDAMSYAAPIAASLSIGVEETAAAIGVLSDNGIQGQRAGTGLRTALAALSAATPEAERAIRGLGLTLADVNPQTNDLVVAVQRLKEAGLDAASAFQIFGREGAPAVLALAAGADDLAVLTSELDNAGGSASTMADILSDNLGGSMLQLRSATDELFLSLNDTLSLVDNLRGFVDGATESIRIFAEMIKGNNLDADVQDVALAADDVRDGFLTIGLVANRVWKTIKLGVKAGEAALLDFFEIMAAEAEFAVTGVATLFEKMFNSIVAGINGSINEVNNLVNNLPDWAKDLLGIDGKGVIPTIDFQLDIDTSGLTNVVEVLRESRWEAQGELQQAFNDLANADEDYLRRVNEAMARVEETAIVRAASDESNPVIIPSREGEDAPGYKPGSNEALDELIEQLGRERQVFGDHFAEKRFQLLEQANAEEEILREAYENKEISEQEYLDLSKERWRRYAEDVNEITRRQALATQQVQLSNYQTVLGMTADITAQLGDLAKEGTAAQKALFVAQKGIAIAQAIINTELAATRALAEGGFILGIPMSAAIRALGYASVGLMVGQTIGQLATGNFAHGGIVGGNNFNGDNQTANVNSGEMILNFSQQKQLLDMANGQAPNSGKTNVQVVIHNHSGERATTRRSQTQDGELIEVIVGEAERRIASTIQTGDGEVPRALESNYQGIRRGVA